MTTISVMLLTYSPSEDNPRTEYARISLKALCQNLTVQGDIKLHIADDGSWDGHIQSLKEIADLYDWPVTASCSNHKGYGASFNLATQTIHIDPEVDYILPIEDDWQLVRRLDLTNLAKAMKESQGTLRCVRLGYLGWTQPLFGELHHYAHQSFILFDPDSAEPHVFAGHPRLETIGFERSLGLWPEGTNPGDTEFEVAHRLTARVGVAWPLDMNVNASQQFANTFAHIGAVRSFEVA